MVGLFFILASSCECFSLSNISYLNLKGINQFRKKKKGKKETGFFAFQKVFVCTRIIVRIQ